MRVLRTGMFFFVYSLFILLVVDLGQRAIIWPFVLLRPAKRRGVVRLWLRYLANSTLWISRVAAGVHVTFHGTFPKESCLIVMNHQSLLDCGILGRVAGGPQIVIPTRERYARGIPGISSLIKLGRFPLVTQQSRPSKTEVAGLLRATNELAAGETTIVIFPEGHRTPDGSIFPFMRSGLRLLLRAHRPIYYIVSDGLWHARTLKESVHSFANSRVHVEVRGPFAPPEKSSIDGFIDDLHARMTATLAEIRQRSPESTISAVETATP